MCALCEDRLKWWEWNGPGNTSSLEQGISGTFLLEARAILLVPLDVVKSHLEITVLLASKVPCKAELGDEL